MLTCLHPKKAVCLSSCSALTENPLAHSNGRSQASLEKEEGNLSGRKLPEVALFPLEDEIELELSEAMGDLTLYEALFFFFFKDTLCGQQG